MNDALNIQELGIVVSARNHNPAVLTPDFLKYSGIVPEDWELARQPVNSNRGSQVSFQNGVNIVAKPSRVIFSEPITAKEVENVNVARVARKYLTTLPKGDYHSVRINIREYVTVPEMHSQEAANNYIVKTLLAPGPWLEYGTPPVKVAMQFAYSLERCQCQLSVNEGIIQMLEEEVVPVVVFSAIFSYEIAENEDSERWNTLCQHIDNWQVDRETFSEIINSKFLSVETYSREER